MAFPKSISAQLPHHALLCKQCNNSLQLKCRINKKSIKEPYDFVHFKRIYNVYQRLYTKNRKIHLERHKILGPEFLQFSEISSDCKLLSFRLSIHVLKNSKRSTNMIFNVIFVGFKVRKQFVLYVSVITQQVLMDTYSHLFIVIYSSHKHNTIYKLIER